MITTTTAGNEDLKAASIFWFSCREVYMKNISEQELLGKVRMLCPESE